MASIHRRWTRIGGLLTVGVLAPVLVIGSTGAGEATAAQAAATDYQHPVTIDQGTCQQSAAEPTFMLGETAPRGGEGPGGGLLEGTPVLTTEMTIPTTIDDLTTGRPPYVLLVHQSGDDPGQHLACGAIQGPEAHGKVVVGLHPVGGSGYGGIAILDKDEQGFLGLGKEETRVTVYVLPDATAPPSAGGATAAPAATPAAAPEPPTPTAPPAAGATGAQAATSVTVDLVDIAFHPKAFAIPANTPTTVTLHNTGAIVHNFNIDRLNLHSGDVQPGQTKAITINAPAGTYQYYCNIPGHKEAGMVGTLTVK